MTIVEQIQAIRISLKVSQSEIAEALGITRQAYTHLENGSRRMRVEQAEAILAFLGYQVAVMPIPLMEAKREIDPQEEITAGERFSLMKLLYLATPEGMLSTRQLLQRCLHELNQADLDNLNRLTVAFLDGAAVRDVMVRSCRAMAGPVKK